jgi:hypothetical protein
MPILRFNRTLRRVQYGLDSRHGLGQIPEAARTAWIANLAGASPRRDVFPDTFHGQRTPCTFEFRPDRGFRFAKAIADRSDSEGLLLPHRDTKIAGAELAPRGVEVHDVARGIRAETMIDDVQTPEGCLRQKSLHRLKVDGAAGRPAGRTAADSCLGRLTRATAARHQ